MLPNIFSVVSQELRGFDVVMECVIDIQGFINNEKRFVPKEATVILLSENSVGHWIVTPPIPFNDLSLSAQVYNDVQTKINHGIEWFDGDIQARKLYSNLREVARQMTTVYVHGANNANFIENLIAKKVIDLEKLVCESAHNYDLSTDKTLCITHGVLLRKIYTCTMANATFYKKWILKNRSKIQEHFTPAPTTQGDTLSQAVHVTFNSSSDLNLLRDNEYFTATPNHQNITCSGSGCISSRSYPYEVA